MSSHTQALRPKSRFLIKQGGKYGYINESGLVIIKPRFDKANDFSEGLARVAVDGKYGYIDESGNTAIEMQFKLTSDFSEGLAYVWTGGKNGYIDRTGTLIIEPQFDGAGNFSEGLGQVNVAGKDGFINRSGQIVIGLGLFKGIIKFSEGLAVMRVDNKWGYIDKTGRVVIKPQFDAAGHFREGLARVSLSHDMKGQTYYKMGFIDSSGHLVIKCEFDDADDFSEGLARVNVGGQHFSYGRPIQGGEHFYIDKTGKMIIDANKCGISERINLASSFSEGMAKIELVENLTHNFQSKSFIHSLFSRSSKSVSGSSTEVKWRCGYIDKAGNIAISPQVDDARDFQGGLAGVNIGYLPFSYSERGIHSEGKWGYINKSGEYVWKPTD